MKLSSILTYGSVVAALAAAPGFVPRATASPAGLMGQFSIQFGHSQPPPPPPQPVSSWTDDQRRELRHVYWQLENADRDYGGHRKEAMEQIRKAAEIVGMDLHGEGYAERESMRWSDHSLREARDQLADLERQSGGHERDHLHNAVHELDRALDSVQFGQPQAPPVAGWTDDQRRELRHVYAQLANADRDYDGHRREAMEQIRKAAEIVGVDLHGEGYNQPADEPIRWSDHALRESRDQLADLERQSGGDERDHLHNAVHELDRAMDVR